MKLTFVRTRARAALHLSMWTTFVALMVSASACETAARKRDTPRDATASKPILETDTRKQYDSLVASGTPRATFAGGCFWCMETAFEHVPGVIAVISGYTGGREANPTYETVSSGATGHAEAAAIFFDSTVTSYAKLLDIYWRNIDPMSPDRQFCDAGKQYRAVIFTLGADQRRMADSSKQAIIASKRFTKPVVTEIVDASTFTPAEEYHQDFYLKEPDRYEAYRSGCQRDTRLKQIWGSD